MSKSPRLSLIVPAYNAETTLVKGLSSFLSQETSFEYEVIVVIDPSKDQSVALANALAASHPNLKVIATSTRLGPARCRYEGVLASSAPYIAFADCDDLLLPGAFEDYVRTIEEKKVDVVVYNYYLEKKKHRHLFLLSHQGLLNRYEAMKRLFADTSLRAFYWNKVFTRESLLKKPLLIPTAPNALFEDTSFMASVFSHVEKVYQTRKAFYVYIEEGASATQRPRTDRLAYHLACYASIQRLFLLEKEDAFSKILAHSLFHLRIAFLYDAHVDAHHGGLSLFKARGKIRAALKEFKQKDPSFEEPIPTDLVR
jgi:glycosyltransferase involved in cell wall biosynthesis